MEKTGAPGVRCWQNQLALSLRKALLILKVYTVYTVTAPYYEAGFPPLIMKAMSIHCKKFKSTKAYKEENKNYS